ncbi:ABC transporter permease [Peterkaempfera griseoplana]|uniref:ABC transporter permease n=1 Tax=Peterkaempfera griseoplana TaxID=66896 RepID=UPI0006E4042D|nr:ABC transporter permease [Peterkaempfera griseoplana]
MNSTALRRLTAVQFRLQLREPAVILFGTALPIALVTLFGLLPSFREHQKDLGGLRLIDVYVPTLAVLAPAILALTALPVSLATFREKGVLRRLSASPVPVAGLLGAQLAVICVSVAVTSGGVVAIGGLAFGARAPEHPVAAVAALVLGSAALLGVGLVVAAVAPSAGAASAAGVPLMILNFFFAGLYVPMQSLPHTLVRIGEFVPLGAMTATASGRGPAVEHLAVLACWALAAGAAAVRFFRWE